MDKFKKLYSIASGKSLMLMIAIIAIFTLGNTLTTLAVGSFDRWAGTITDSDGTPLDATIRIGSMQTGSDADGKFQLYVPRNYEDSSYVINVESHGYVPISQIHIGEALEELTLQMKRAQVFEINPQEDFRITDNRGTQIAISSGSLVDANGYPATGPLQLLVYTYDITEEEMVGNMSGRNSAGELVSMESVGAFYAEFTDQSGNAYNLGQGSNAEISVPNDPTGNFPTTIPLWSYNAETGLWIEEGQATLQGDRYVGDVSHFSFWNFDAEKRTPACIRLTVDPDYLNANKPIQVKALLLAPLRARYLNIIQDTNVLINLPVNTNVEFYIPTTASTPFAVINTGDPWGGTGIPSHPYEACNASLHIDGSHDKGRLWGKKFHDIDGDGVRDADEPGLSGWTITATDADDNSFSEVTDANGDYRLLLSPGTYSVVEVQQPGWVQTYPTTTAHSVTVEAAKTTERVDFGNTEECQASTVDTMGAIFTDSPPADIGKDINESNDTIVFAEVQNFVIPSGGLDVDITTSGNYTDKDNLTLGTIAEGTAVDSYLIRLDPERVLISDATFKFSRNILGIVVKGRTLLRSQMLARADVNYPDASSLSGLEFDNDWITLHSDMRTIELHLKASSPSDNVRVITEPGCSGCPDPFEIETAGVEFLSTPLSDVSPNASENDHIVIFNETQDFSLPNSGIAVDITASGTYSNADSLTPGILANNVPVHSYHLNFDPTSRTSVTGTIKFSERILGVIVTDNLLDSSDLLGHPDVTYPTPGRNLRGLEIGKGDSLILHPDMQTLELSLRARSPGDHIRVITAVSCSEEAPPPPSTVHYFSSSTGGKVNNVRFADEDILVFDPDTGRWSIYFDGSDVGLGLRKQDVNAFHVLENGDILLSTNLPFRSGGVTYDDSDIVYFAATSLGTTTAGEFTMYLDGSDVQLTRGGEDIDAIAFAANGDLVISTLGSSRTPIKAKDDDLLQLKNGSFGDNTSGTWEIYFDGSDAAFTKSSEDIWATWINTATQEIHLSTAGNYNVSNSGMNLVGDGDDVFVCVPGSIGSTTQCTFRLSWNGDDHGFGREKIDGYSTGAMPTGLIFSASLSRVDLSDEETASSASIDDIVADDVLDEEDIISRHYLPVIQR